MREDLPGSGDCPESSGYPVPQDPEEHPGPQESPEPQEPQELEELPGPPDPVALLVRQGLLALAEALDLLAPPAREDLRAVLALPGSAVLRQVAAHVDRVVSRARAGLLVLQEHLVVRGLPWSPDERQGSLFPPSTSGGSTGQRR